MQTGYDAGKKTKGVKRHVRVDTLGSMLRAVVPPASKQDRDGLACVLDRRMRRRLAGIEVVFADRGLGAEGGRGCGASRHVDAGDPATRPRADGLRRPADAPGRRAHPLLAPARQTARKGCRTPRPIRRGHDQANAKALVQIAKRLGQALSRAGRCPGAPRRSRRAWAEGLRRPGSGKPQEACAQEASVADPAPVRGSPYRPAAPGRAAAAEPRKRTARDHMPRGSEPRASGAAPKETHLSHRLRVQHTGNRICKRRARIGRSGGSEGRPSGAWTASNAASRRASASSATRRTRRSGCRASMSTGLDSCPRALAVPRVFTRGFAPAGGPWSASSVEAKQ